MQKSTLFKIGGGTVIAATFGVSTFIVSTFLPSAEIVSVNQARWLTALGFGIFLVGMPIGLRLWVNGNREKEKEIIASKVCFDNHIAKTLQDINIRQGEIFKGLRCKPKTIDRMMKELYREMSGINANEDVKTIGQAYKFLMKWLIAYPIMKKRFAKMGDRNSGLVIFDAVKNHSDIGQLLSDDNINKPLYETLQNERAKLPSIIVEQAAEPIDNYLDYSVAYWSVDILIQYDMKIVKKLPQKGIMGMASGLIISTFRMYRRNFERQMNRNLAKVCKVVNV